VALFLGKKGDKMPFQICPETLEKLGIILPTEVLPPELLFMSLPNAQPTSLAGLKLEPNSGMLTVTVEGDLSLGAFVLNTAQTRAEPLGRDGQGNSSWAANVALVRFGEPTDLATLQQNVVLAYQSPQPMFAGLVWS
jgi:hypothetical protein